MADQAARTRSDAIQAFAAVLRDLRESVGNPSFREMSGRSRAISHTTLHEAAQGNRLPSWATTAEFVKACAADPAEYRERWARADRAIRSVSALRLGGPWADSTESGARQSTAIPAGGTGRRAIHFAVGREAAPPQPSSDAPPEPPDADDEVLPSHRSWRRLRFVLPGAAAVAVAAVVVVVVVVNRGPGPGAKGTTDRQPPKALLSPADCPMHASNPPPAPPEHPGDASQFVADITLPDCTHIRRGQTVTKVWRVKNVGKVPWTGYSLHRVDLPQQRDQCQTISDVPIADTRPGELVDIRADITAPPTPGFCYVRFKTVDAAGHVAFPGFRPVNFQIIVD